MAFTLSGSTVTVSGTETSLAGAVTAGGATSSNDTYDFGARNISITGSLTVPNAETILFSSLPSSSAHRIVIQNGGSLVIGTNSDFGRYQRNFGVPVIFEDVDESNSLISSQSAWSNNGAGNSGQLVSVYVADGGTLTVYGQTLALRGCIGAHGGADITIKNSNISCDRMYLYDGDGEINLEENTITCQKNFALIANFTKFSGNFIIGFAKDEEHYLNGSSATPEGLSDTNRILIRDAPLLDNNNTKIWSSGTADDNIPYIEFRNAANGANYSTDYKDRKADVLWTKEIDFTASRQDNGNSIAGAEFYVEGGGTYKVEGTSDSNGKHSMLIKLARESRIIQDEELLDATQTYFNISNNKTDNDFKIYAWAYGFFPFVDESFIADGNGSENVKIRFITDHNTAEATRATVQAYDKLDTAEKLYDYYCSYKVDNIDALDKSKHKIRRIDKTVDFDDLTVEMATDYDENHEYKTEQAVYHNGNLYSCDTDGATGTFDSNDWSLIASSSIFHLYEDSGFPYVAFYYGDSFDGNVITSDFIFIKDDNDILGTIGDSDGVRAIINVPKVKTYLKGTRSGSGVDTNIDYQTFDNGGRIKLEAYKNEEIKLGIYSTGYKPKYVSFNTETYGNEVSPEFEKIFNPIHTGDDEVAWKDDFKVSWEQENKRLTVEFETVENAPVVYEVYKRINEDNTGDFIHFASLQSGYLDMLLGMEDEGQIEDGLMGRLDIKKISHLELKLNDTVTEDLQFTMSILIDDGVMVTSNKNASTEKANFYLCGLGTEANFSRAIMNGALDGKLSDIVKSADIQSLEDKVDAIDAAPSVADIAAGVWNEATEDHVAEGSFGKLAADIPTVAQIGADVQTRLDGMNDVTDTEVATAILGKHVDAAETKTVKQALDGIPSAGNIALAVGNNIRTDLSQIPDDVAERILVKEVSDGETVKEALERIKVIETDVGELNNLSAEEVETAVPSTEKIAAAVRDEFTVDGNSNSDTFGVALNRIKNIPLTTDITNAIRDKAVKTGGDTFGEALDRIKNLNDASVDDIGADIQARITSAKDDINEKIAAVPDIDEIGGRVKTELSESVDIDVDETEIAEAVSKALIEDKELSNGKMVGETIVAIEKAVTSSAVRFPATSRKTTPSKLFMDAGSDFEEIISLPVVGGIEDFEGYEFLSKMVNIYDKEKTQLIEAVPVEDKIRTIRLSLTNEETSLLLPGRYKFDVDAKKDGKITKIMEGTIDVIEEITKANE